MIRSFGKANETIREVLLSIFRYNIQRIISNYEMLRVPRKESNHVSTCPTLILEKKDAGCSSNPFEEGVARSRTSCVRISDTATVLE